MESQLWIFAQIVIDVFLIAILLWFVRFQRIQHKSGQNSQSAYEKSESILSEMKKISQSLEQNLEQKRALSRHILQQLDEELKRAEKTRDQLHDILRISSQTLQADPHGDKDSGHIKSAVTALLNKGLPKEEVAQYLGLSLGEIELLMKLRS